jgi:hypothetical protein
MRSASARVKSPLMTALPRIVDRNIGAAITFPSRRMAIGRPRWIFVASVRRSPAAVVKATLIEGESGLAEPPTKIFVDIRSRS